MAKKKPGAKRGPTPQKDEKNLTAVAAELASRKYTKFEIETETRIGGEVSYNLSKAISAAGAEHGFDGSHSHANRKRLYRKIKQEYGEGGLVDRAYFDDAVKSGRGLHTGWKASKKKP